MLMYCVDLFFGISFIYFCLNISSVGMLSIVVSWCMSCMLVDRCPRFHVRQVIVSKYVFISAWVVGRPGGLGCDGGGLKNLGLVLQL